MSPIGVEKKVESFTEDQKIYELHLTLKKGYVSRRSCYYRALSILWILWILWCYLLFCDVNESQVSRRITI